MSQEDQLLGVPDAPKEPVPRTLRIHDLALDMAKVESYTEPLPTPSTPLTVETLGSMGALGGGGAGGKKNISLQKLFGKNLDIDFKILLHQKEEIKDPALFDVKNILAEFFSPSVSLEDVNVDEQVSTEHLDALLDENYLEALLGPHGIECLKNETYYEPFEVLQSSLPPAVGEKDVVSKWLVEMPKIIPNRQILHADPKPYSSERSDLIESNDRMLYTPHNVIRWTYNKGHQLFLSNARVVKWSDGSVTLHVGMDTHLLHDNKGDSALHLLGYNTVVGNSAGMLPAVTSTVHPDKHFVTESSNAKSISIEIANENKMHHNLRVKQRMPVITEPLPPIDLNKPAGQRNPLEEYVAEQYEKRKRLMESCAKKGQPLSLEKQLEMERELWEQIRTTDLQVLRERQEEEKRQQALRGTNARRLREFDAMYDDMERDNKRVRFERSEGEYRAERTADIQPLLDSLRQLLSTLNPSSDHYGAVDGTLNFLRSGTVDDTMAATEVGRMLEELKEDGIDTSAVDAVYSIMFPDE